MAARAEFEELSLIKVFDDWKPASTAVNYWVPKNTTNTFASIIFRYWRCLEERHHGFLKVEDDVQVWTDIKYRGDGTISGTPQDEWESISTLLTSWRATGKLEHEDPYPKYEEDNSEEDDSEESSGSEDCPEEKEPLPFRPLVLKVMMIRRSSQAKREAKKAKKPKTLSRVSFHLSVR
jgi:hypothetical protein